MMFKKIFISKDGHLQWPVDAKSSFCVERLKMMMLIKMVKMIATS